MTEKNLTKVESRPTNRGPLAMFDELVNEFEGLWQKPWLMPFNRRFAKESLTWTPRLDAYKKDGELIVKADLPGMKREDFQVYLEEGNLILKGERKEETKVDEPDYYKAECFYGSFYRRLPLTFDVAPEKITAKFIDGVLEVHVPMPVEATPAVKEIPVN
ncbi:MAG TPA: Hsp20/alpha crystallin family protein [Solirubrobacterales bacterium]|nr:Hsp20/alpha crystallin family protein [Solirubrobacterales bacterium]